jgi:hypothetical protein
MLRRNERVVAMRRYAPLILVVALLAGCQKKHPVKVRVDPAMEKGAIEQIAVFPFASSLHSTDDPEGLAPRMMDQLFRQELDARTDYKFLSPESVEYALRGGQLQEAGEEFVDNWLKNKQIDQRFLEGFRDVTQADALLIGVVDLWQKDEVDYRETSTPATYVGATITIIGITDGKVLFEAVDEDFLEGALTEAADRGARVSGSGAVQSDRAANVYQAPEYEEVAVKVARALASSIPRR